MNRIINFAAGLALGAMASGCGSETQGAMVEAGDPLDAQFSLAWTTEEAVTGDTVPCASIGADTVRVISNNIDTGETFDDSFACSAGQGTTGTLDAGDYVVTADLDDCRGSAACPSPDVLATVTPVSEISVYTNEEFDLGHVVFKVTNGLVE